MKVLILSVADKRHMPMVAPYIRYLNINNISYDIVRANRYQSTKQSIQTTLRPDGIDYEIDMVMPMNLRKWQKLRFFLRFYFYAVRIIKQNCYSHVIVWNENTAALFSLFLIKNYSGKYCVNVRDPISDLGLFGRAADCAVAKSFFSTVPTPEAEELKGKNKDKYIVVYNRDYELLSKWATKGCKREKLPIRLTHLGVYSKAVRGSIELADLFGNDKRFELNFYGAGFDQEFQEYISNCGYTNINTKGSFVAEKTRDYLQNTDIINSYYNMYNQPGLKNSFGIKHSYTPMLYLPGLADENTAWGRLSKPYNMAFLVNDKNRNKLPDLLFKWYSELDFDTFVENCDKFNLIIDESITRLFIQVENMLSYHE